MTDALNFNTDVLSHHIEGFAREGNTQFSCPLISEVEPGAGALYALWQGGCRGGVSLGGRFNHIVSLYPWETYNAGGDLNSFTAVRLYDGPTVPDEHQLYHLAHWINNCRTHGPTLVHCQAGLNRSGLLAALSLVVAGAEPAEAIQKLRDGRSPAVLCNKAFAGWLLRQKAGQQKPEAKRGRKPKKAA